MWILSGNTNEIGNVGESPRKSSLFFLTTLKDLEIELIGDKVFELEKQCIFCIVWCTLDDP